MTRAPDTIVAVASGAAPGGIGVVRISGSRARRIGAQVIGRTPRPRRVVVAKFRDADGTVLDHGVALCFVAPRSYTGEDVVELQAHGNPLVLELLVARCVALGARRARPGEFSERAFLNGKLDLAQAEAIADLIAAGSEAQARGALRSLEGEFSRRVTTVLDALVRLRIHVEAAIDFPEEEIDFLGDGRVLAELDAVRASLAALLAEARRGARLREGLHVVLIGRPNAGKSSLLNALAGSERAIVTAIPGTTRDLLRETVRLGGVELTLVDTAGLRDSGDAIEAEGVRRARAELERADLALLVLDATHADPAYETTLLARECPPGITPLWVHNKIDLVAAPPGRVARDDRVQVNVSARTGAGLDDLRTELARRAGATEGGSGAFSARARHVEALERVGVHLETGAARLRDERAGELLAEELRQAQGMLGTITGAFTSDDLLGAIFASFCIGK